MQKGMSGMPTNRSQHIRTVGLMVTVGLLLALAVQVGLTAATGSSGASQGKVRIEAKGKNFGGRFTISGAIRDRGRFIDSPGLITVRKLIGAKGTIWIKVGFVEPFRCQCNWRIVKGTKAYAGLRGRGHEEGVSGSTINVTMTGTVSR
jgi:hypothetical protein